MLEQRRTHGFIWFAAALLVVAAGYRLLADRSPEAPPVAVDAATDDERPGAEAGAEAPGGAAGRGRPAGPRVYVHVAGAVRRPGLYRLPGGARVAAAIELAGGPRPKADLTGTNLAARVQDGQQIVVATRGRAPAAAAAAGAPGAAASAGAKISLASATQAQLEELDGIGPALASRIIEYRDSHGGFRSVEELGEVDGIGEVRLDALRQAVSP